MNVNTYNLIKKLVLSWYSGLSNPNICEYIFGNANMIKAIIIAEIRFNKYIFFTIDFNE